MKLLLFLGLRTQKFIEHLRCFWFYYFIDSTREKTISHPWKSTMIIWKKWRTWVRFSRMFTIFLSTENNIWPEKEKKLYFVAFNLIEGIDVQVIEAKIARYQEENAEQIVINRARKVPALLLLMYKLFPYSSLNSKLRILALNHNFYFYFYFRHKHCPLSSLIMVYISLKS